MKRTALATLIALSAFGCAAPARYIAPPSPSLELWRAALTDLGAARKAAGGDAPRTLKLAFALTEPFTGRRTEARGAVALSPAERAVRMILVGPGGTTAFDMWIRGDKFRMSIPALDMLRRGDASTPREQMRGLPVDFLRWWLLEPTRGELLWVQKDERGAEHTLRDGDAIIRLRFSPTGAVKARRQTWARPANDGEAEPVMVDEENVTATLLGCGDARYTQQSTGVEISITCEGVEPNPPSERAFVDPDAAEEAE
jgi:hypothetical protein